MFPAAEFQEMVLEWNEPVWPGRPERARRLASHVGQLQDEDRHAVSRACWRATNQLASDALQSEVPPEIQSSAMPASNCDKAGKARAAKPCR